MTTRSEQIRERFERHVLEELKVCTGTPTLAEWNGIGDYDTRFGWVPPLRNRDGDIVVVYQPDVIAETMAKLPDESFDVALTAIEFLIDMHIVFLEDGIEPEDERTRRAESALYDMCGPDAMKFLTYVQMEAIS